MTSTFNQTLNQISSKYQFNPDITDGIKAEYLRNTFEYTTNNNNNTNPSIDEMRLILYKSDPDTVIDFCSTSKHNQNKVCTNTFWKAYLKQKYDINITKLKVPLKVLRELLAAYDHGVSEYDLDIKIFSNQQLDINFEDIPFEDYRELIIDVYARTTPPAKLKELSSLQILFFDMNKPLKVGMIPRTVRRLQFGSSFNQPIGLKVIPNGVTDLIFGYDFDQPFFKGIIPNSVRHLVLGQIFDHPLEPGVIPESVEEITFHNNFSNPILPGVLPNKLKRLVFTNYNQPLKKGLLPSTLKYLDLGLIFNHPIKPNVLPDSIEYLNLGAAFNAPLQPGVIPNSTQKLIFGHNFNNFNQVLKQGVIPNSVEYLEFGNRFNQPFSKGVIPNSVQKIVVGDKYNQPLKKVNLPKNIEIIKMKRIIYDPHSDIEDYPEDYEKIVLKPL